MLGQHRSTQRCIPRGRVDEGRLVADMIELARKSGHYGYRRIAALLRDAGWQVNDKRVERLWRREGLKVPEKQPKRGHLWLNDGSCTGGQPRRRSSCQAGRPAPLRSAGHPAWLGKRQCTNIQPGPVAGGRSGRRLLLDFCFSASRIFSLNP